MSVRALTVELGLDRAELAAGLRFWTAAGPGHLVLAPTPSPWSEVRFGLWVADVAAAVARARAGGAQVSRVRPDEPARLRSPSGFPVVLHAPGRAPDVAPVATWPGGHRSRVDQLCIDVAPYAWDVELRFVEELTRWPVEPSSTPGFARLRTPAGQPVRVLLQRREHGPTTGHLDVATTDRRAEVARLEDLGAVRAYDGPRWTTLRPPAGPAVCVTDRDPATGLLPGAVARGC